MAMTGRLLILTLYYPPDLSAGAFRTAALVEAIRAQAPSLGIDVMTSMPNRYHTFSTAAPEEESAEGLTIRRLKLPPHRNDMLTQASSYARFAWKASRLVSAGRYDLVFATSSRLMTATLGAWIARRVRAPLYLDIRDLFADTMSEVLSPRTAAVVGPGLAAVERWTVRRAVKVNLVSPGFAPYFQRRYPATPLSLFTNGIDDEFLVARAEGRRASDADPLTVVYAGNIGEGQGLHHILPALAGSLRDRVRFRVIGDGGRRAQLADALRLAGVTNVEVLPPVTREALIAEYQAADVLFLHLNDYDAFTRVLPSKIFEYAAMGKPIWAGVGGCAAEFIRAEVSNAAVFAPCDAEGALRAWDTLEFRTAPREAFVRDHARTDIMARMAADLLAQIPGGAHR
jgi:glycosyltransferase involved in cell wall biosynthesis